MTDIFNEVDEEVRRDRMMAIWQRYGVYFVAAAVVLVLAVGGYEGWRAWQQKRATEDAMAFGEAVRLAQAGKSAEAAAAYRKLTEEGTPGYRALAGLRGAAAEGAAGDQGLAAAAYERVAKEGGVPALYRDVAELMAAYDRLDQADLSEMRRRLDRLAAADGPWRHLARELLGLAALKANDLEAARKSFAEVADDATAPAGARGRSAELLASLKDAS